MRITKKKEKQFNFTVGTSLILVVFVLIALVTFATLSYVAASSNYNMSRIAADNVGVYYDATKNAVKTYENIYDSVNGYKAASINDEEFVDNCINNLADGNINILEEDEGLFLLYTENISYSKILNMKLRIKAYDDKEPLEVVSMYVSGNDKEDEEEPLKLLF